MRIGFHRSECGRPHRVEVIFLDEDGQRLLQITGTSTPEWEDGLPANWTTGALLGFNLGVPLPRFGAYSFEILLNDNLVRSIPLRVVRRESPEQPPG
jgi:hypothetical protein